MHAGRRPHSGPGGRSFQSTSPSYASVSDIMLQSIKPRVL
jgi:hypothetical protein